MANHKHKLIAGTQPEFLPLILVKDHLKIDGSHEDDYLESIRDAAIGAAEDYLGTFILHRDVEMGFENTTEIALIKYGPILDPDTFQVIAKLAGGGTQDITQDFTHVQPWGGDPEFRYKGSGFPTLAQDPFALSFKYVAGCPAPQDLPGPVRQAMLLMAGDMYEFRVDRASINNTRAMALMRPYKVY